MDIKTIIGGVIIVALLALAFYIRMKNKPTEQDKELADNFLKGLSDTFYTKMIDIISNIDINIYGSIEEFETAVLGEIYDTLLAYTYEQLKEVAKKDILTTLALKLLDKKTIEKFVAQCIKEKEIGNHIEAIWEAKIEDNIKSAEKEDEDLQNEFDNPELYNEEFDTKDLPKAEPTVEEYDDSDLDVEDSEKYDEDDASVETVDLITKKDKNGNELYYIKDANGKKSRISKAEAAKYM